MLPRSLLIFIAVTLSSGWIGVFIDNRLGPQPEGETLGMGLWLVMPFLTALLLVLTAKTNWRSIGLAPKFRHNLRWYVVGVLIFPVVTVATILLGRWLGWVDLYQLATKAYLSGFAAALLPGIFKNFFEEFVWRGYLTSKLIELNLKDGWVYVIVGAVWGAWHLPYYLCFLPESALLQVLPVSRILFALVALITMMSWTVMYVELYRITKSIWPVILLHTIEDATVNHLIIDQHVRILGNAEWIVSPIVGVLPSVIYLIVGWALRRARVKMTTLPF